MRSTVFAVITLVCVFGLAAADDLDLYQQYQKGLKDSELYVQQAQKIILEYQLKTKQWQTHRLQYQDNPEEVKKASYWITQCQTFIKQQSDYITQQDQWQKRVQRFIDDMAERNPQIKELEAEKKAGTENKDPTGIIQPELSSNGTICEYCLGGGITFASDYNGKPWNWYDLSSVFGRSNRLVLYSDNPFSEPIPQMLIYASFKTKQEISFNGLESCYQDPGMGQNAVCDIIEFQLPSDSAKLKIQHESDSVPQGTLAGLNGPYVYRIFITAPDRGYHSITTLGLSSAATFAVGRALVDYYNGAPRRVRICYSNDKRCLPKLVTRPKGDKNPPTTVNPPSINYPGGTTNPPVNIYFGDDEKYSGSGKLGQERCLDERYKVVDMEFEFFYNGESRGYFLFTPACHALVSWWNFNVLWEVKNDYLTVEIPATGELFHLKWKKRNLEGFLDPECAAYKKSSSKTHEYKLVSVPRGTFFEK